jgi:hypothetical protein
MRTLAQYLVSLVGAFYAPPFHTGCVEANIEAE